MRKRRVIVFDDEAFIRSMLRNFFAFKGYEALTLHDPAAICPMHGHSSADCGKFSPCADVMITDFRMPHMDGLELIRQQSLRGCSLDMKNKAVISGYVDQEHRQAIERMGCAFFKKPFSLTELSGWLAECEKRMDLSEPLATRRSEERYDSYKEIVYRVSHAEEFLTGTAVNVSDSGLCLKAGAPLAREQWVNIHAGNHNSSLSASVRWVERADDGSYLAGLCYQTDSARPEMRCSHSVQTGT